VQVEIEGEEEQEENKRRKNNRKKERREKPKKKSSEERGERRKERHRRILVHPRESRNEIMEIGITQISGGSGPPEMPRHRLHYGMKFLV